MNRKPVLSQQDFRVSLTAAALSILIGTTLPRAVADLFVSNGTPFQHAVISAPGCRDQQTDSRPGNCVRWLSATWTARRIANR